VSGSVLTQEETSKAEETTAKADLKKFIFMTFYFIFDHLTCKHRCNRTAKVAPTIQNHPEFI
jgi:hypothetical protein